MQNDIVIDLYHNDSVESVSEIYASGIRGVIHKASQGLKNVDPQYGPRRSIMRASGLMFGAYHFGTGDGTGAEQAAHFLASAVPDGRTLCVLDFERNTQGATMSLAQAIDFVTAVHAATGRWPGIYSGDLIKETLGSGRNATLAQCWLWLAEYGATPHWPPTNWLTWTMWQYTDAGNVPGMANGVDRDYFNGDLNALRALWGYPAL